jgi:prepilin-type N-terminal cleavage/methylation domain-containing protein
VRFIRVQEFRGSGIQVKGFFILSLESSNPRTLVPQRDKMEGVWMKNKKGVTLVELLVGLLIFAIAFGAALLSFIFGMQWAKITSQRTSAVGLAQAKMEEAFAEGYYGAAAGVSDDNPVLDAGQIGKSSDDVPCLRRLTVTNMGDHKELSVVITWTRRDRQLQESLVSAVYP